MPKTLSTNPEAIRRRAFLKAMREKHGSLYSKWIGIKRRCGSKSDHRYPRYGGRGITVCDEWKSSFHAFESWARSNGFREDLELDRIDNDGGYSPENCRWVDRKTNVRNSTVCSISESDVKAILQMRAERIPCTIIAKRFGVSESTVYSVVYGKTWNDVCGDLRGAISDTPIRRGGLKSAIKRNKPMRVASQTLQILACLHTGSKTAVEILGVIDVHPNSVYTQLNRLEAAGYTTSKYIERTDGRRGHDRVFNISAKGKKELKTICDIAGWKFK